MALADALENVSRDDEIEDLRRSLTRTQQQLLKAKAKVDDLVAATIDASRDATFALGPITPTDKPALTKIRGKQPEVALWDTGDWQFGKKTTSYDSEVATRRVLEFADKAISLTELHRQGTPVNDAVIVLGGDMIEGVSFNFPTQPFEIDATLFTQFAKVSRLLVQIVQKALANYERVTVVGEWGNHGRIGSKRDAVPRADNLDRMCYELARQLLASEPRLTWEDTPEDVQRIEVGNYRAVVLHGDEVGRNGFASPSTLVQHMNRWKSGAYRVDGEPWRFRDAYIHHFHTHNEWALADGEGALYQTGSTESDNRYAAIGMASSALPSQRLHMIDPVKGRVTSQWKVHLD